MARLCLRDFIVKLIIVGKILVGHQVDEDLDVLHLSRRGYQISEILLQSRPINRYDLRTKNTTKLEKKLYR